MRGFQAARKILEQAPGALEIARRVGLVYRTVYGGAHPLRQRVSDVAFLMRVAAVNQNPCTEDLDDRFVQRLRAIDHH